jgi:AraC-like DNA-binding protein
MHPTDNRIFKDSFLPFVECRHTLNSGKHYRPHRHATLSIGAITEGAVSFSHDGVHAHLVPGTLITINPEVTHACNPIEGEARSYYMLYLDVAWCQGVQSALWGTDAPLVPVEDTLIEHRDLYEAYLEVCETLLDADTDYLAKEERLQGFAEHLFGLHGTPDAPSSTASIPDHSRIETASAFMREHRSENLTLAQIADAAQISPAHFARRFKIAAGTTPHDYLLNLRIERTRELLATDMPIAQIALEAGFSDQSHLNRVFTPIVACTPGEYRRGLIRRD